AVFVGQIGKFAELCRADTPGRHTQTDRHEPRIVLTVDPQMVDVMRSAAIGSGWRQCGTETLGQLATEPRQAPLFDQEGQPAVAARVARTVIAVDANQFR